MGKSRPPPKRKPAAAESVAAEPVAAEPAATATGPSHEVVIRREPTPPVAPMFVQVVETLRLVAERMMDIADAAAEAVKKRIEGRA